MKKLLLVAIAYLPLMVVGAIISGCDNGDVKWNDPTTNVTVSMKGCRISSSRGGSNDLVLNIENTSLPDGRMQCTITTIRSTKTSQ